MYPHLIIDPFVLDEGLLDAHDGIQPKFVVVGHSQQLQVLFVFVCEIFVAG